MELRAHERQLTLQPHEPLLLPRRTCRRRLRLRLRRLRRRRRFRSRFVRCRRRRRLRGV
jgi:hypothetical protein